MPNIEVGYLVEQLRNLAHRFEDASGGPTVDVTFIVEAADTIDALRAELAQAQADRDESVAQCALVVQENAALERARDVLAIEMAQAQADAALGKLVREMPPHHMLQRAMHKWTVRRFASDDLDCAMQVAKYLHKVADKPTPEAALQAALDAAKEQHV